MSEPEDQSDQPPRSRVDRLTTILMGTAALFAIGGFGVLFSIWLQSGITDKYEVLRIASREYVAGHPIVAGDLAETVEFDQSPTDPLGEVDSAKDSANADGQPPNVELSAADRARIEAERQAEEERQEWIRLREFLIGAGKLARADNIPDQRERRQIIREALPHLELAGETGFPPGRQTEGNRMLGESYFALGRYADAIGALGRAIAQDPSLRREFSFRLAEAQLYSPKHSADRALETIQAYLKDRTLQPPQVWAGQRTRIRALIELQRWDDVERAITSARHQAQAVQSDDQLIKNAKSQFAEQLDLLQSIAEIRTAGQRRVAIGDQNRLTTQLKFPELKPTLLRLLELQREAMPPVPAEAKLWSARAQLIMGNNSDGLALLTSVRSQRPLSPTAIIGGLEEIELLSRQGRGEEVLQTTRYLMRELGDKQGFQATEVSFPEFRRRIIDAVDQLRQNGKYEAAIDVARTLPPVFDASEALIQEGIGFQQWAAATNPSSQNLSAQASRGAAKLERERYRAAGDAFAEAAQILFDTAEYLPTQWSAISAYQKGRHFSRSIALLEPYLRYEQRRRQPRGLVAFGRALLAEGAAEKAIEALAVCIDEFPRDPLRYDARLLAALAHSENGDLEKSRELLTANLQDGDLTPQSPAFRDSLFTLAELLYQSGYQKYLEAEQIAGAERLELLRANQPTLEEAVRYLDEAVDRYKWIPRAESAAYMSARAHILASRWPRLESESPEILDTARRSLRAGADAQLQIALDGFTRLKQHLLSKEDEQGLPQREQSLLRNCYIAGADVLREMNRLDEAATAYQAIELRYMNEPTALEAIVGRASCLRSMERPDEADMLIKQANVVLGRIPKEWNGRFADTTRYDREGWQELLTWMNSRIENGS